MLNKEQYKEELENILAMSLAVSKNGKISHCASMKCGDCIFFQCGCANAAKVWLNSEYQEYILTEEEKTYWSAVIKPFRDRVKSIVKLTGDYSPKQYIRIFVEGSADAILPTFNKDTMYKGMQIEREYALEELGL